MNEEAVVQTVRRILETLPPGVTLVAAAKGRTVEQVRATIRAGVAHVGHNYVQDAEPMIPLVPEPAQWHRIGHLQTNKVKKAVELFDLIETVHSWRLAQTPMRKVEMRHLPMGMSNSYRVAIEESALFSTSSSPGRSAGLSTPARTPGSTPPGDIRRTAALVTCL